MVSISLVVSAVFSITIMLLESLPAVLLLSIADDVSSSWLQLSSEVLLLLLFICCNPA